MFLELQIAGWEMDEGPSLSDVHCIRLLFSHTEIPNVSLDVHVCLDEFPATVYVNLLDSDGIITEEWRDKEIDVDEITERAREFHEEQLEDEVG